MRRSFYPAFSLLLTVLLALTATQARGASAKPNILVVLSYHVGMPWADEVTRGLVDRLGEDNELIITQLDVQRYPEFGREKKMLEIMSNRAKFSRPVMVIAVDDTAYRFVLEHRDEFDPGTPIVFCGVNFLQANPPSGVTGVVEATNIATTLKLMSQLQPNARRWVIVNDQSETGQANHKAFDQARSSDDKHDVIWIGDGSFAETEERLSKLDPKRDSVLMLSWNIDSTGLTRSYESAIKKARAICPVPLYGVWDFYFGHGIVGGALLDGRVHGQEAGDIAKRILAGEKPDSIPVVTQCRTRLKVDYREIIRFSLAAKNLPAEAEVYNRTLSAWEQYASVIVAIVIVIILQGVSITWLIIVIQRRRQARSLLHASEANLRLTLDAIEEAVIVTDTDNQITRLNPAAERLTGYTPAQAQGQPLSLIVPLADPKTSQPLALPTIESTEPNYNPSLPARALLKNCAGVKSIVTYSVSPMLDDKGAKRGIVIVLRDITARHQLEEQLYQAQKMESVGQLAGGIAHDFNNVLAVIVGHGELLRDHLANQPAALDDLQTMLRGAQRATDLVQQILAFSRKTKHEMTPILLQTVVREALKFLRATVPSSIEIAPRISADLPLVLADATQIHQVIMNLCTNAAFAMKDAANGRLEVRLESIHADAEFAIMHTGLRDGEYVRLSVSDTGHGMDEATQKHIFEPFFTTKSQSEGTGLGLSVVHGIIKAHNGGIYVYSRPGEGTIFHIYLPALSIASAPRGPDPVQVAAGKGEHILFVDDEPAIGASARRIVENLGYRITVFTSPLLALEDLRVNAAHYDLLVTDQTMPGLSGINFATAALKIRPDLRMILTTGFAADLTEASVQSQGITKLLLKPFTTTTLAHALSDALKQNRSPRVRGS